MAHTHRELLVPLEKIRRWGVVCPHARCMDLRKAGKKRIACPRNSRRLREAWKEVQDRIAEFQERAKAVKKEVWEFQ